MGSSRWWHLIETQMDPPRPDPANPRRRRRRGSAASNRSSHDQVAEPASPRTGVGVLSEDSGEPASPGGSPGPERESDNARRQHPELPTSEEEEDAAPNEDAGSALLPTKRVGAARKTQRDNTVPLPATFQHVHMIGEIGHGIGFCSGAFVQWTVVTGDRWELVRGLDGGRSHSDSTVESVAGDHESIWAHPVDIYFAASPQDLRGHWPKLLVQVMTVDYAGR